MFLSSRSSILHIATILLRAFAILVGIFAFFSVVIIALHATGYRPYVSIPAFGYELQLAVTEKNIAISLVNSFAHVSQWNLPIDAFDKWSAVMASIAAGISYFASNLTSSDAKTASEKSFFDRESVSTASNVRQTLLRAIENAYIEGQLKHSLFDAAKTELGMVAQQDAVEGGEYPWKLIVHQPGQAWQALQPGTRILNVFDALAGSVLILGAPGSGKTTTLLELTKDLLARAKADPTTPIPVILNLPTWITKQEPLEQWLVDQLRNPTLPYRMSKKYVQAWVEHDKLLLLLDGLDEIQDISMRTACVEAINTFRREHAMNIVVCCRTNDYKVLQSRLQLRGAIELQPLTLQQVDKYLQRAGKKFPSLRDLRRAVQHLDTLSELRELMQTPVMLNIVCLTFKDKPIAEVRITGSGKQLYNQIFDFYVQTMLKERGTKEYSEKQIRHWLAKLAQQRQPYGQAPFYVEQMQPYEWLPSRVQDLLWLMIVGLMGGLVAGLGGWLVHGPIDSLVWLLDLWLVRGMPYWHAVELMEEVWERLPEDLWLELVYGLIGGMLLVGRASMEGISSAEVLHWNWKDLVFYLVFGLVAGLGGWLVFGLVVEMLGGLLEDLQERLPGLLGIMLGWLLVSPRGGLREGLTLGLTLGLGTWLLEGGLQGRESETKFVPNQGVWRSLHNGLVVGVVIVLLGVLLGVLSGGVSFGLSFGLDFGLLGMLVFGLHVFIMHFILRLLLYWNNYLPWRYVRFLDYTAHCIFLHKVYGGYIFIHGLLLDYFAELNSPSSDSLHRNAPNETPTNND